MSATDIFQAALSLPYEVRSQLAQQLLDSLNPPGEDVTPEEWEASWAEEIERRLRLIDSGEMPMLDADEAIARARSRLQEKRRS